MKYLIWFMHLKHLDLNINLLPWHFTLICTQNSMLSYTAVCNTCQKCSELIYSITFLFLALSLWKFTFSERKFDREFKYGIGFAVGDNVL